MPRYELVVHLMCDLDGETPDEAAAIFKQHLLAATDAETSPELYQLALWRQADGAHLSPLPESLHQQLVDFFSGVARSAAIAEEAFRLRVAEILTEADAPR